MSWRVSAFALGLGVANLTLVGCSPKLASVKVQPGSATLEAVNDTAQFRASEYDSDGKALAKTEPVTWTSDNPAVATVGATGTATAVKSGHATLTATAGKFSGKANLEVHIPAKIVGQDVLLSSIGKTQDVAFLVADENNHTLGDLTSKIAIKLADPKVASVAGPKGGSWTFAANLPGKTQIIATSGSVTQNFDLTVQLPEVTELRLNQTALKMKVGESQVLTGSALNNGAPIDGMSVIYTTSDAKVAVVDANGTVHAIGKGRVNITASAGAKSIVVAVTVKR